MFCSHRDDWKNYPLYILHIKLLQFYCSFWFRDLLMSLILSTFISIPVSLLENLYAFLHLIYMLKITSIYKYEYRPINLKFQISSKTYVVTIH